MVSYVLGAPLLLLGLTMMTRGWIYTLRPDGAIAEKRKKVNLKRGFTTDMKVFGRKVRRLGLMTALVGGTLVGWQASHRADPESSTTPPAAGASAGPTTP
jgi:hypothetical protein